MLKYVPAILISLILSILILHIVPRIDVAEASESDGTIIFLIASEEAQSEHAIRLQTNIPTMEVTNEMNEVKSLAETKSIEAIIIDSSSLSALDPEWLSATYRNGTVMAGINVQGPDFSRLLGIPCSIVTSNLDSDFYLVMSSLTVGEYPQEVELVAQEMEKNCGNATIEGLNGLVIHTVGSSGSLLTTDEHFNELVGTLNAHIWNLQSSYDVYASELSRKSSQSIEID